MLRSLSAIELKMNKAGRGTCQAIVGGDGLNVPIVNREMGW